MGGGDGHSEMGGGEQHGCAGSFRSEAVDGMDLHHFMAERFDDAPAAGGGAGAHGQRAQDDDPGRDVNRLAGERRGRFQEGKPFRQRIKFAGRRAADERQRNDAHGFLRVIGAVGETHVARAEQLQFAEQCGSP